MHFPSCETEGGTTEPSPVARAGIEACSHCYFDRAFSELNIQLYVNMENRIVFDLTLDICHSFLILP